MPSIAALRHIRLRPAIGAAWHAIGISALAKPGCFSPQTKMCMHPIEVPKVSRR